jgi:uncharacterized protein
MNIEYTRDIQIQTLINREARILMAVEKIIDLTNPSRIYFVNSLSTLLHFTRNCIPEKFQLESHHNLMVLTVENKDTHTIQEAIENNCKPFLPLTALVLPQTHYNQLLEKNTVFACSVLASAELLYTRENSLEEADDVQVGKNIEKESSEASKRAKGFLSSGELLLLTNEIPLAAFMLHQAIEQYCFGKILCHLGINPKTHNLDKLYRLMRFFTFDLVKVFPRDTEIEERLFASVKDAYIASRYSSSCAIKSADLKIIRDRLRILFKV